jgi:hypothetical protein
MVITIREVFNQLRFNVKYIEKSESRIKLSRIYGQIIFYSNVSSKLVVQPFDRFDNEKKFYGGFKTFFKEISNLIKPKSTLFLITWFQKMFFFYLKINFIWWKLTFYLTYNKILKHWTKIFFLYLKNLCFKHFQISFKRINLTTFYIS